MSDKQSTTQRPAAVQNIGEIDDPEWENSMTGYLLLNVYDRYDDLFPQLQLRDDERFFKTFKKRNVHEATFRVGMEHPDEVVEKMRQNREVIDEQHDDVMDADWRAWNFYITKRTSDVLFEQFIADIRGEHADIIEDDYLKREIKTAIVEVALDRQDELIATVEGVHDILE